MKRDQIDHTGEIYNYLSAQAPTGRWSETKGQIWIWKCQCGKSVEYPYRSVKQGHVKSCGCIRYSVKPGTKYGLLTCVRATEERDHGMVVYEWRCECGNTAYKAGYLVASGGIKSCGCLAKKDGVKFLNKNYVCGTNLGKIRQEETLLQKNNTSGFKGITYDPQRDRYESRISFQSHTYRIYSYTIEKAVRHRIELRKIHDDFLCWWDSLTPEEQLDAAQKYENLSIA